MSTAKEDDPYFRYADRLWPEIKNQKWRFVALLVAKKPISVATNDLTKTHPMWARDNPNKTTHAEYRCLLKVSDGKALGSTLIVWRFLKNKQLALALPCPTCMGIIRERGVKIVLYSTNTGFERISV